MKPSSELPKAGSPLNRGITFGCILFILILCVILGMVSYSNYRSALYSHYEKYLADLLKYIDTKIDDDDLTHCIETGVRSTNYDELEVFMDTLKEDFDVHSLYILKPLNTNDTDNMMYVLCAGNDAECESAAEEKHVLGYLSGTKYSARTAALLLNVMNGKEPVFFEDIYGQSNDYTAVFPLYDSTGNAYAELVADIDITNIKGVILQNTLQSSLLIILFGAIFTLIFLFWINRDIVKPLKTLEKSVLAFADQSHGQHDISLLEYQEPQIHTDNEVEILSDAITKMTQDMKQYVTEILSAEKKAESMQKQARQMKELATRDALTEVGNKTAYDKELVRLNWGFKNGMPYPFGIAMIDLNYLKKLNDTYGHEKGNLAIRNLSALICEIFKHSPVFRIGGDEFVVILKGKDYKNCENLVTDFKQQLSQYASDDSLQPWEKISAAIGVAFYDKELDSDADSVFKRADQEMYLCKKQMKAVRTD